MRGTLARNIARDAGFHVVPVDDFGVVRVVRGVLEVGPDASPDAIATLACRRICERDGLNTEDAVQKLVADFGFEYTPTRNERPESGVAYRAVG